MSASLTRRPRGGRRTRPRAARALRALLPGLLLVLIAVVQPSRGGESAEVVVALAWLVLLLVVAIAGCTSYLVWRLDERTDLAWVCSGVTLLGLYGVAEAVDGIARHGVASLEARVTVVDVVVAGLAATALLLAARAPFPVRRGPLWLAGAVAAVAATLRLALPVERWSAPAAGSGTPLGLEAAWFGAPWFGILVLGLGAAATAGVLTTGLPRRLRTALAGAVVLATAAGVLGGGGLPVLPATLTAWVLVVATALSPLVVRGCWREAAALYASRRDSLRVLAVRASRAEADRQREQDRMHELRATAAGVASASEVLAGDDIHPSRRAALAGLLIDESDRLRRLTQPLAATHVTAVDLDDVLSRAVTKQSQLGQVVRWECGGHLVRADAHVLREIVDVLLVNAQEHAPGAWARVAATRRSGAVVVRFSDNGPGVPDAFVDSLFHRGARGASSGGSGIGLHLARRLADEMGGSLRYVPNVSGRGACFVLTLAEADGPGGAEAPDEQDEQDEEVTGGEEQAGSDRDARGTG